MLTKKSLKGAIEIARAVVELKRKYPKAKDYKERYKPTIYNMIEDYKNDNHKKPNLLFKDELVNVDFKNLFDSKGFQFYGNSLNNHVWSTLRIKPNGDYNNQPQFGIAALAECIRFGLGYGDSVKNDNTFVERVRKNKNIQLEILKVLKAETQIKFINLIEGELIPSPKSEIKIKTITDIENNWKNNTHLMGVIAYGEINNNSGKTISKCLKELYNLFQMICLDNQSVNNVEYESADTEKQIEALEKKYKDATPEVVYKLVKTIERGSISKEIKKVYGYKCLVCEALSGKTVSFKKKKGDKEDEGDTYIETHHLIEVYKLIKGTLGVSNLITVCANHHRQFHFGNIEIKLNTKDILKLKIDGKEIAIKKIKL